MSNSPNLRRAIGDHDGATLSLSTPQSRVVIERREPGDLTPHNAVTCKTHWRVTGDVPKEMRAERDCKTPEAALAFALRCLAAYKN